MAYAKLIFPIGTPVSHKLKDIARFCGGNVSVLTDFEYVDISKSEITIYEATGWNSLTELTNSTNEYIFSSKCENPSKTKYASLSLFSNNSVITTGVSVVSTRPAINATTGILFTTIASDINSGTLVNQGLYNASFATNNTASRTINSYNSLDMANSEFYISISNRKLFIYSTGNRNSFISALEFPETQYTNSTNNLPVVNINCSNLAIENVSIAIDYDLNKITSTAASTSTLYQSCCFTDWYKASDNQRANRAADTGINNFLLSTVISGVSQHINTYTLSLVPLLDIRTALGEGIHHYSSLTDIYLTNSFNTFSDAGLEIHKNNTTYVLLSIGSIGNYRTLAIKKA